MAPRTLNKLTDLTVRKASALGWYGDGGGLYLRVDPKSKRWVFVYQWLGKRAEMGLGPVSEVSLSEARDVRDWARKLIRDGKNPVEARRLQRAQEAQEALSATFASWAREIAPSAAPKAAKAHAAWLRMMTEWTGRLKDRPIAQIGTEDVLGALKPYWKSRPETGRRMRMRIEIVLDAARARGLIADPWQNPARWKGHLQHLLETRAAPVKHPAAQAYADAPEMFQRLTERDSMAAYALAFTILTAARTSEVVYAKWSEIDLAEKVWTVPASRMKMKREHRVPLSDQALAVLAKAKPPAGAKPQAWVFPSLFRRGRPLSTAAMERILHDMDLKGVATVHGFRSTFRDWAGDATNFPRDTVEAALAHLVGDETERAYRRGDALLKRRKLMETWAGYLLRAAGWSVRPLSRPG